MSSNLDEKKKVVEEIKQKITSAKSLAFVDYRNLTVEEATSMRAKFREVGAEYKVYKNRLMLKALEELGHKNLVLEGTSAVAFGYQDEISAPKIVAEVAKQGQKLEIKFGMYNGEIVDKNMVEKLASIPNKETLLAQLLCVLNGPVRGLAVALNAVANK